jgi:peptide chain release factor 1
LVFGEGGTDSKLFVSDLYDAYTKYANRLGLTSDLLLDEDGHIIAKFVGKNAGHAFRYESGKHTIQRVPPTERSGRRQTSMVSVMVMPMPPDNSLKPLPDSELDIKFQTGKQKAGGQNVNRVCSACRMVHRPTGMSVFINGRDQGANRKEALRILTARVNEMRHNKEQAEYGKLRKEQWGGGNRGNKIRTYNFCESRAVDHRFGIKTGNVDGVIRKGQLDLLMPQEVKA